MAELNSLSSLLGSTEYLNSGLLTNNKAYYRFESGALTTDSSGQAHTLTAISDPAEGTGKFGGGVDLDGNDAYSATDHADFKPTGNYTIGMWIKSSDTSELKAIFQSYSQNTNGAGIYINTQATTGKIQFVTGQNNGSYVQAIGTSNVCNGALHYIVCVDDGTNLLIYVDGVLEGSSSRTSAPVYAATNYVRVGCLCASGSNTNFFVGSLDDLFLINGTALTATQINTIFGAAAYFRFNTGALTTDSKGIYTLTNNNTVGEVTGKYGIGADFGSSNTTKYFDIANNLGLNTYAAGIFSMSGWFNLQTPPTSGTSQCLFGINVSTKIQTNFTYENNGGTMRLNYSNYSGSEAETVSQNTTLPSGWFLYTLVKNGRDVTFYVNGSSVGTVTSTLGDASPGRPDQFTIGRDAYNTSNYFKGYVDDAAIFTRALTAAEILQLYQDRRSVSLFFSQI